MKKSALVLAAAAARLFSVPRRAPRRGPGRGRQDHDPRRSGHHPGDPIDTFSRTVRSGPRPTPATSSPWLDGDKDPTGQLHLLLPRSSSDLSGLAPTRSRRGHRHADRRPGQQRRRLFRELLLLGRSRRHLPIVTRDMATNCANQITWNTSASRPAPTGWSRSTTIRRFTPTTRRTRRFACAHGGTPLPSVLVVRPDGYGSWDTTYHLQWMADGKGPLTFDLQYGLEDTTTALTPQSDDRHRPGAHARQRRHVHLRLGRVAARQQQGLLGADQGHRRRWQLDLHALVLRGHRLPRGNHDAAAGGHGDGAAEEARLRDLRQRRRRRRRASSRGLATCCCWRQRWRRRATWRVAARAAADSRGQNTVERPPCTRRSSFFCRSAGRARPVCRRRRTGCRRPLPRRR